MCPNVEGSCVSMWAGVVGVSLVGVLPVDHPCGNHPPFPQLGGLRVSGHMLYFRCGDWAPHHLGDRPMPTPRNKKELVTLLGQLAARVNKLGDAAPVNAEVLVVLRAAEWALKAAADLAAHQGGH